MNRVWIEVEFPKSKEEGELRAKLLSNMLRKLGVTFETPVWWWDDKGCYCFTIDEAGGFVEGGDSGHWYSLDYFGKEEELPSQPVEYSNGIPEVGDKVRFLDANGYDAQLLRARERFYKGQILIVRSRDVGDWSSSLSFEGVEGNFNSVMFEIVKEKDSE